MEKLERRFCEPALLRGIGGSPALFEDARQALLVTVLFGREGASPALAEYSGRGTLERWLRAAALHVVTRQRRREQRVQHVDREGALGASGGLARP
jgi:DNA-directed RNA polymerase specialized sigma24 family protein